MAMSALSTSALSSLEAMLLSLMRGSSGGGGGDIDAPLDDTLASPPPPPLPARPTARGRHPSWRRAQPAAPPLTLSPPSPPPSSSSPPKEQEDATSSSTTDDVSLVVEELERKAAEVEAQLRRKEEENAALKRRIESYHIRWLEYEIRIKSLEEAFHEQMATLQLAQDAARRAEEAAARDRRECPEPQMSTPEDPPAPVRLWHGRDRMLVQQGARRSAVSRLSAEFRRQSHTLERGAAALVAEAPPATTGPWQPAVAADAPSSGSSADDLKRLKAQFRAWAKDYKARLRRAKAELGGDRRRRQGSCWI